MNAFFTGKPETAGIRPVANFTAVAGSLVLLLLSTSCAVSNETADRGSTRVPAAEQQPDTAGPGQTIAPFDRHRERYQTLFSALAENGMTPQRITAIFASAKAKQRDTAAIERLSVKRSGLASLKSPAQLADISTELLRHIERYATVYDRLERRFGVNREIAAAILYKETHLGRFSDWQHDAFVVFNNILSFLQAAPEDDARQRKRIARLVMLAQDNLQKLLLYCEQNTIDITRTAFPSSFAGAIGMPQFLPVYLDYAVSDGAGRPDLSKAGDAILSLGNLLKQRFDWPGLIDFDRLQPIDDIYRRYIAYDQVTDDASFCMTLDQDGYPLRSFAAQAGDIAGIDYISGYGRVLMQYNFSSYYVLDVLQLAYHIHRLRSRR